MTLRKSQIYRWLMAQAIARKLAKRHAATANRRRSNLPTLLRRRASDPID